MSGLTGSKFSRLHQHKGPPLSNSQLKKHIWKQENCSLIKNAPLCPHHCEIIRWNCLSGGKVWIPYTKWLKDQTAFRVEVIFPITMSLSTRHQSICSAGKEPGANRWQPLMTWQGALVRLLQDTVAPLLRDSLCRPPARPTWPRAASGTGDQLARRPQLVPEGGGRRPSAQS